MLTVPHPSLVLGREQNLLRWQNTLSIITYQLRCLQLIISELKAFCASGTGINEYIYFLVCYLKCIYTLLREVYTFIHA